MVWRVVGDFLFGGGGMCVGGGVLRVVKGGCGGRGPDRCGKGGFSVGGFVVWEVGEGVQGEDLIVKGWAVGGM